MGGFIEDARQKLADGKAYVRRVRDALKVLERNKGSGIPLPRGKSKRQFCDQLSEEQHSV